MHDSCHQSWKNLKSGYDHEMMIFHDFSWCDHQIFWPLFHPKLHIFSPFQWMDVASLHKTLPETSSTSPLKLGLSPQRQGNSHSNSIPFSGVNFRWLICRESVFKLLKNGFFVIIESTFRTLTRSRNPSLCQVGAFGGEGWNAGRLWLGGRDCDVNSQCLEVCTLSNFYKRFFLLGLVVFSHKIFMVGLL